MANNGPSQDKKSGGCGKFIAIGCGALVILLVIGGVIAYQSVKGVVSGIVDEYTGVQALILPQVEAPDAEVQALIARVDGFSKALKDGSPSGPLVLDARAINLLINHHPSWAPVKGMVHAAIEGDQIKGQVSLPLDDLGDFAKGRFLNGSAVLKVMLASGRLFVFAESLSVKGKPLPETFMQGIRSENLAKNANNNPNGDEITQKLESITVANGKMTIVPKKP